LSPSSDLSPPPGPPSSNSSGSTTAEQAKPTAPVSNVADLVARHVEKEVAHLLLSCARGGHTHQSESTEASTKAACTSVAATACSTSAAPSSSPSVALTHTATSSAAAEAELVGSYLSARAATDELDESVLAPGISLDTDSLVASGGVSTPEQAVLVARRDILVAQDQIQVQRVVRTLGMALGASRIETGTTKALHAVLLQLAHPEMNDIEAYSSTGASRSNFTKWRRRVQQIHWRGSAESTPACERHHLPPGSTPPPVHASGSHSCCVLRRQ
jgi:hypothetical protein